MERGAAGDSRKECAAKTAKTVELFYLAPSSVLIQVALLVDCCRSRPEKKCILCWCDYNPQLQNLNSCKCRNL